MRVDGGDCGIAALTPLTCILTTCPSPLLPLIIAVTTTSVSLFTKFRIHRSFLELWPECATRSNLRAWENGRTIRRIKMSSTIEEYLLVVGAMVVDFRSVVLLRLTMLRGPSLYSGGVAELFVKDSGGQSPCNSCQDFSTFINPLFLWRVESNVQRGLLQCNQTAYTAFRSNLLYLGN